jgi:hypothetical protein
MEYGAIRQARLFLQILLKNWGIWSNLRHGLLHGTSSGCFSQPSSAQPGIRRAKILCQSLRIVRAFRTVGPHAITLRDSAVGMRLPDGGAVTNARTRARVRYTSNKHVYV